MWEFLKQRDRTRSCFMHVGHHNPAAMKSTLVCVNRLLGLTNKHNKANESCTWGGPRYPTGDMIPCRSTLGRRGSIDSWTVLGIWDFLLKTNTHTHTQLRDPVLSPDYLPSEVSSTFLRWIIHHKRSRLSYEWVALHHESDLREYHMLNMN